MTCLALFRSHKTRLLVIRQDVRESSKIYIFIYLVTVDPCTNAGCEPGHCKNENGTAVCFCSKGYELASDGKTCEGEHNSLTN